jgi:Mu transposase, C-terminal domain
LDIQGPPGGNTLAKLTREQLVTIEVLQQRGQSASQTARILGVTEGAVRYHLRRARDGVDDGRWKPSLIEQLGLEGVVAHWWLGQAERLGGERPPSAQQLHDFLSAEHGYNGSYKSVRKYVRVRFGVPRVRPFRRVETPPGAQTQSDWGEFRQVDLGDSDGPTTVYAFVMVLSHSRKEAVVWSRSTDQLAWHHVHNEAYRRLGGVAAVNRIDNLKTGIARGCGAWGHINEQYLVYARMMGFHVDACEVRAPEQKGKTERRVGDCKGLDIQGRRFDGLAGLQGWTDADRAARAMKRICPATGLSVAASWEAEKPFLRPLPQSLPEPFDLVKTAPVHKDRSVHFEGRTYIVPFSYAGGTVEVRGCSGRVQILDPQTAAILISYPRHTQERILIDPRCYEGPGTAGVSPPKPLGRMARKLQEIAALPVERRPVDLYAALAEVAR